MTKRREKKRGRFDSVTRIYHEFGLRAKQLFNQAYVAWKGRLERKEVTHAFNRWIKKGNIPNWVRKYIKQFRHQQVAVA